MSLRIQNRAPFPRLLAFVTVAILLAPICSAQQWSWKEWRGSTRNTTKLSTISQVSKAKCDEPEGEPHRWANFHGADLRKADLRGADLHDADLHGADLRDADLSEAKLTGAHLENARLAGATLSRADLTDACLNDASLTRANLDDAILVRTDLEGAGFEPRDLPPLGNIAFAKNLEFVIYAYNPDSLAQLRKEFEDNGFRTQQRQITRALRTWRRHIEYQVWRDALHRLLWFIPAATSEHLDAGRAWFLSPDSIAVCFASSFVDYFVFENTCFYGRSAVLPLMEWAGLWFCCGCLYWAHLCWQRDQWLFKVGKEEQKARIPIRDGPDGPYPFFRQLSALVDRLSAIVRPVSSRLKELKKTNLHKAFYFSLTRACNFGFRDIKPSDWLSFLRIEVEADGWVSIVATIQSIASGILIVLSILSYFGNPFG